MGSQLFIIIYFLFLAVYTFPLTLFIVVIELLVAGCFIIVKFYAFDSSP